MREEVRHVLRRGGSRGASGAAASPPLRHRAPAPQRYSPPRAKLAPRQHTCHAHETLAVPLNGTGQLESGRPAAPLDYDAERRRNGRLCGPADVAASCRARKMTRTHAAGAGVSLRCCSGPTRHWSRMSRRSCTIAGAHRSPYLRQAMHAQGWAGRRRRRWARFVLPRPAATARL